MYDFAYQKPGSLADAVKALSGDAEAKALAGGMTYIPVLKQRLANAKSWAERLFAFAMLGDDRAVARTWVAGETAYRRS